MQRQKPIAIPILQSRGASGSIGIMAALFAVMHAYPVLMPCAYVYGLAAGFVRERTGSTFNPLLMQVLNSVLLLCIGLSIFG